MTEPRAIATRPVPQDGEPALLSRLESLRGEGAWQRDPVRLHYLERLAQRMCAGHGAVRRVLAGKLQDGLTAYGERLRQERRVAPQAAVCLPCVPLVELNQHLRAVEQDGVAGGLGGDCDAASDMRSVRRFRDTWRRVLAEDQVDQAVARAPANAGPLNSHSLVLRSLALMRDLSPDYLRRFMSQVDALLWLDDANSASRPVVVRPRPVRQGRQKK